jgi:hypothetical protein
MLRDRRANVTVVDILTQKLEIEQDSCRRQSQLISDLKLELLSFQGLQVWPLPLLSHASACDFSNSLTRRSQPKVKMQQARVLSFVKKFQSRMLLMTGQFHCFIVVSDHQSQSHNLSSDALLE